METKYYSVKEFAELLGISPQSIYKRLKKHSDPIHQHTKTVDNKTLIADSAVEEVFKREFVTVNDTEPAEENKTGIPLDSAYTMLLEQIEVLQGVIENKDKEIQRLSAQNERLTSLLEEQQTLTKQQQQLSALDKQKILLLEEKVEKKKKGLFHWFNRKEVKENG